MLMEYLRDFAEHLVLFPGWDEEAMGAALDEVERRLQAQEPRSATGASLKLFGRAVGCLRGYLGSRDEALLVQARTCAEEAHDRLMAAREELARLSPLGYRDW